MEEKFLANSITFQMKVLSNKVIELKVFLRHNTKRRKKKHQHYKVEQVYKQSKGFSKYVCILKNFLSTKYVNFRRIFHHANFYTTIIE